MPAQMAAPTPIITTINTITALGTAVGEDAVGEDADFQGEDARSINIVSRM